MPLAPAARIGDPATHDGLVECGKIDFPLSGPCPLGMVMIEGLPAAHANCSVYCTGVTSSGAIPHPLHAPPPPPAPAAGGTGAAGVPESCGDECPADEEEEVEFTIQIMGGSSRGAGVEIAGVRHDHIVFRITDPDGNAAIYDFQGAGLNRGVAGLPVTAHQPIAAGDPVPFNVPKGTRVDEFEGPARMTIKEAVGYNDVTFRFGIPKDSGWDRFGWNDDFVDDLITGSSPMVLPAKIRQHAVRVPDMEIVGANHDVREVFGSESLEEVGDNLAENFVNLPDTLLANPSVIGAGESKGGMTLSEYIPVPIPVPVVAPVPCLNPIVKGSTTVYIHGMPAARWMPSGDQTTCVTQLGSVKSAMGRTVWIGG